MNRVCSAIDRGGKTFVALLILLVSAGAPIMLGTTLARMTLSDLAAAAQVIARVRCVGAFSRRESDSIWTYTDFTVEEIFKGAPGEHITIRLPGGHDGHLMETVDGVPRFAPGDDAIVFLERTRAGVWSISAWAEGTFRVAPDSGTGQQIITQDSSSMAVFDARTRTFRTEGITRMPLSQFRVKLASAIESGGR